MSPSRTSARPTPQDTAGLHRCAGNVCSGRYFVEADQTLCELCLEGRAGLSILDIEYLYGDHALESPVVAWEAASRALAALSGHTEVVSPDMRLLARFSLAIPLYDVTDPFGERPLVRREDLGRALRQASGL